MKILLVFPSTGYYTRALSNPLGLLSIGSHLKRKGHDVKIYDRCVDATSLRKILDDFAPDMAGISVMSSRGIKDAIKVSRTIKKEVFALSGAVRCRLCSLRSFSKTNLSITL